MSATATGQPRYDITTIALHWLMAPLIAVQWLIGQTSDYIPRGAPRADYIGLHLTIGALITVALLFRLAWRIGPGRKLPAADRPALHVVAKATHWAMYVLLATTLALGIANALAGGSPVFTIGHLPGFAVRNIPLRRAIQGWHGRTADAVLILAAFHSCAALFHHYVLRDRLIRRMAPAVLIRPDR